ncbi:PHD finger protein 21A [Striga asiatica]|uniref:PHD finger protein 21A n=1 Tax=Striga asiatica TaxID=4170 RepID=A0A5A7P9N3_STRAF|nr:PHD finger protein 21A [Striga asiatica]
MALASLDTDINHIYLQISPLHLKPPFPEMSKWDLQSFIQYKKSSLTRHALQQVDESLENAVCTGGHSFLASLKERSGLKDKKEPEHGVTGADDGDVSQRDLLDENIAPLNRKRRATSENLTEDVSETHVELVKKNKHDIISHEPNVGEKVISAAVDAQLADKTAEYVKHSEGRRYSLGMESSARDVDMDRPSNEIGCTSPKGLGGSNEVLPCEKQVIRCDTEPNKKTEAKSDHIDDIEGEKGDEEVEEVNLFGDGKNDDHVDITTMEAKEQKSLTTTRCRDQNMAGTSTRDSGEERCSLGKEADVEVLEKSRPMEDVKDMYTSLKGHVTRDGVLPQGIQAQDLVPPYNDNFDGEERQDRDNENPEGDESVLRGLRTTNEDANRLQLSVLGDLPNIGENEDVDMSTDSDGCHDERTNIATQKETFLNSQCTYSQDSLATTDWRGTKFCVKCNLGEQLLVCGSDSCPLVIHQSCLDSDADFDPTEEFYCQFCAYSRAISKYMETKKILFCLGTQNGSGKQSRKLYKANENNLDQDDGRKVVASTNTQSPEEGRQSFKSQKASGEQQRPAVEIDISLRKSTSGQVIEGRGRSEKRADIGSKRGTLHSPETDLPHGNKSSRSSQSTDVEETSEQENENSWASKNFVRVRKQKTKPIMEGMRVHCPHYKLIQWKKILEHGAGVFHQCRSTVDLKNKWRNLCKATPKSSHPAIPQLRRKRIPWTIEEEEKLKEGMRVHCSPHDKLIPWQKILEYGAGVFHQCRSTVDLKDKWRNLCKATQNIPTEVLSCDERHM